MQTIALRVGNSPRLRGPLRWHKPARMRRFWAALWRDGQKPDWLLERTGFEPPRSVDSVVVDRGLNLFGNELTALFGCGRNPVTPAAHLRTLLANHYQGTTCRSRKRPPVGPSSGSVASQTGVSAPSSGHLVPVLLFRSVRQAPGLAVLTLIEVPRSSFARETVNARSAQSSRNCNPVY